jgi:hypothetical protein
MILVNLGGCEQEIHALAKKRSLFDPISVEKSGCGGTPVSIEMVGVQAGLSKKQDPSPK